MITYPCAKINLGLNVVSKRPDGYHNLETVFYPVPLCDTLEINMSDEKTSLTLSGTPLDGDPEQNLVIKAYRAVCEQHPLPEVKISLDKHIPSQAGMGGGSSDCAFTIKALNEMFNIGMSDDEMRGIASKLGADC
ncbi:MAG: 4-(cytidine 5'-diphospho)-2-C-methyl-D-erythritol kinase, partial [Prevotella sp.]|nr:4-(cytidine 5'-diphospho)-2-C-methyl-D-erythritol kinase [Prevotella sp.]